MNAGKLRHRVQIQQKEEAVTEVAQQELGEAIFGETFLGGTPFSELAGVSRTRDVYGGVIETWGLESYRWADIVPLGGRALFEAQQVDSRLSHVITLRHHPTISTQNRILYRTRIFQIQQTRNPDEVDRMTELRCMEQIS